MVEVMKFKSYHHSAAKVLVDGQEVGQVTQHHKGDAWVAVRGNSIAGTSRTKKGAVAILAGAKSEA